MTEPASRMRREIDEIPAAVDRLLTTGVERIQAAAEAVRAADPAFLVSVARGSSDHVCTYLKYACELLLGIPVASVGPSISSIYDARLKLSGAVCLSVSQSGKSPDIVTMASSARQDGALTLALTNDPAAPLAHASAEILDICAGPELSVAATKTFVSSACAGLMLLAYWKRDSDLTHVLQTLPGAFDRAGRLDWPELRESLGGQGSLFTLGRGPVWAISNEAALKFKEVCQLHAESYSSAEVLHGPVSIIDQGFPVLALAVADAAEDAVVAVADELAEKGAAAFVTSDNARYATRIPRVDTGHPLTDPLALAVSFYAMVERLATSKGIDPDRPRHLKKVTETL